MSNGLGTAITPITTQVNPLTSAVDVTELPQGGLEIVAAFDNTGQLATYGYFFPTSEPRYWGSPVLIEPPNGTTFSFSPTICGDDGLMGNSWFTSSP